MRTGRGLPAVEWGSESNCRHAAPHTTPLVPWLRAQTSFPYCLVCSSSTTNPPISTGTVSSHCCVPCARAAWKTTYPPPPVASSIRRPTFALPRWWLYLRCRCWRRGSCHPATTQQWRFFGCRTTTWAPRRLRCRHRRCGTCAARSLGVGHCFALWRVSQGRELRMGSND